MVIFHIVFFRNQSLCISYKEITLILNRNKSWKYTYSSSLVFVESYSCGNCRIFSPLWQENLKITSMRQIEGYRYMCYIYFISLSSSAEEHICCSRRGHVCRCFLSCFYSHSFHVVFVHLEWTLLTAGRTCHHYMCSERRNVSSHNLKVVNRVQVINPLVFIHVFFPILCQFSFSCSF